MSPIIAQEAKRFLIELFTQCNSLAKSHPDISASEITIRHPEATRGRSPYLLRKSFTDRKEQFELITSGVSAPKMFGIIDQLAQFIGGTKPRISAVNEEGQEIDSSDLARRGHIAFLKAEFSNGVSTSWTSVSGLNIFCPDKHTFTALVKNFSNPVSMPDRAI